MRKALKNYRCRLNLRKQPCSRLLIIFKHGLHFSKPTQKLKKMSILIIALYVGIYNDV